MARGISKEAGQRLRGMFEAGSGWEEALKLECPFLEEAEYVVIVAAEKSGSLPAALKDLGESRKERAALRTRIVMTALYPLAVLHLGALLFPVGYLAEGNLKGYLAGVGLIVVPLWGILVAVGACVRVSPRMKRVLQSITPIIRSYSVNRDLAAFCRTLSTCIHSGLDLEASWKWALRAADSDRLYGEGSQAILAIQAGRPASEALTDEGGFPVELRQLYRLGERTGRLDENMNRAADSFAAAARKRLLAAALVYPQLLFLVVAGYVAVKVVGFYRGYFEDITNMM